jgi:kynurenine formamidase
VLSMDFARLLVSKRVKIVGMDMPSPDDFPFEIHKYLLSNDVLILENLTDVSALLGKEAFEVMALPLRIQSDSAIAWVIARVMP